MSWILIAIIAYFILAIVNLADKFLLEKVLPSAKTYTFLVGFLGLIILIIAPWFLNWPGLYLTSFNIFIGFLLPLALILLYTALRLGEASKIITIIGGSVPIFTILLSFVLLGERFTNLQYTAFFYLIFGTLIISYFPGGHELWTRIFIWFGLESQKRLRSIIIALSASFIFALFFVGSKYLYNSQEFISAFIWIRIGSFLAVLFLLLSKKNRKEIFKNINKLRGKKRAIFLGNQGLAAGGFFLQNYAIALGSVALVNALQGVQYAFLLILASFLTIFYPQVIKEKISKLIIFQKMIAIILISFGLYFIIQ